MNLIIDIGNTWAKIAVYENNNQRYFNRVSHQEIQESVNNVITQYLPQKAIVSNVSSTRLNLSKHKLTVINFTHETKLPLQIKYNTPHTLGLDRIAVACGALYHHNKKDNLLVIDAGTCITYDFITKNKEFIGGAISPGINMRLKAMHHFTGKLPDLFFNEENMEPEFIGKSTNECIFSGAFWGTVMEINGNINRYNEQFDNVYVFLTGGDANKLQKHIKNRIFANPFLLLDGLNYILEYNS
jgi:type III pantothenate kinase